MVAETWQAVLGRAAAGSGAGAGAHCGNDGGEMRFIAFITEAVVVRGILAHLDEATSPPRMAPARGPPL